MHEYIYFGGIPGVVHEEWGLEWQQAYGHVGLDRCWGNLHRGLSKKQRKAPFLSCLAGAAAQAGSGGQQGG